MDERALARVEEIRDVRPIDGADAIEAVVVRGWTVVARRGEFAVGDRCVYFEINSFLPVSDERFAFLAARGTRTVDGVGGHVLRSATLRGVVSQGLALRIDAFGELDGVPVGTDVTSVLGITKYEPPIPAELAGVAIGAFPTEWAPKTDAERVQNLVEVYPTLAAATRWQATEKVDGSSVTYIRDAGRLRVCSRNLELAAGTTTLWRIADELGVVEMLRDGDVIQAELYGDGIQSNRLRRRGQHLAVFAMWRDRQLVARDQWPAAVAAMAAPVYPIELPGSVEEAIAQADGIPSMIAEGRRAEGIVWHSLDGRRFAELGGRGCFKVISNAYLLRHGE